MNAQLLMEKLLLSGVRLTTQGDRLRIDAPKGVLTTEIRQLLRKL